jgi:hypothetical protein
MQHVSRSRWVLLALALCLAAGTGALVAQDNTAGAAAGGVTFVNNSHHDVQVFARYGGTDDSCLHQPNQMELHVTAGSSSTVDSGSSNVCFCLDVPDRNSCPTGWGTVKAGHKRVFQ